MARAYVCDACGITMPDPHKARMREFYVGLRYEYGHAIYTNRKSRCKVHLCDDCYHALHEIAGEKRREENAAD